MGVPSLSPLSSLVLTPFKRLNRIQVYSYDCEDSDFVNNNPKTLGIFNFFTCFLFFYNKEPIKIQDIWRQSLSNEKYSFKTSIIQFYLTGFHGNYLSLLLFDRF